MADKPHITPEDYVARLVQTGVWASPQEPIQYSFLLQQPSYLTAEPGFVAFSAAQQAAVEHAFAMIAEVVDLTFVEIPDNQQQPGASNPQIAFYANSITTSYSGSMQAYYAAGGSSDILGADIRINTARIAQRENQEGFADFTPYVILHEVLHALGLSHPGDYNGQGFNYEDHAEFVEDTIQYSVMSYWAAAEAGADHVIGGAQYVGTTPLLYDILALQSLYAPNMTTRTGDTVYGFNSNTGDSPFNFAAWPNPVIAIWDAGGSDTLDLSGYASASLIDLNEGQFSSGGCMTSNIAIAFGVTIENGVGGGGGDTLIGNAAANILDGGEGADAMSGGLGDDCFIVDNAGDAVGEAAGEGTDLVESSVTCTLSANVENLTLTGGASSSGTGNALANVIVGNAANNLIDGGAGADSLRGGGGNDIYVVDSAGDVVIELAGAGVDTVRSSVGFTLGANVENMVLTGAGSSSGTGNALANTILGNGAANYINGAGGQDSMRGGAGNDTYVVDNGEDVVVEASGAGIDTVRSSVTYRIGSTVENLVLLGTAAVGTGNDLDNIILGSDSTNFINGDSGGDSLRGGGGNDTYVVDDSGDVIIEFSGAGTDTVRSYFDYRIGSNVENMVLLGTAVVGTGNSASNIIIGTEGTNFLNGDGGADSLRGGAGNDTYVLDHSGDSVVEAFGAGTDTVRTYVDHTLGANVENMVLIGNAEIDGNGNGLNNTILGNDLANIIRGVDGNDSLRGLGGDDTLVGGNGNDSLLGGSGGDDFVFDAALSATTNVDEIRDFSSSGGDEIVLDQSVFASLALGTLSASAFHTGTAAADADDRIVYDSATGRIYYDADGNGAGEQTLFATVTSGTSLTNADFFVIA